MYADNMGKDWFANLPPEIIFHILSRLPVLTIICCKCVCKSWLALLETPEFVESHLLNATPGLAIYGYKSKSYQVYELEDLLDLEHPDLHYRSVTEFKLDTHSRIYGSFSGFLLVGLIGSFHSFCIYNPITLEYLDLSEHGCPVEFARSAGEFTCGFGESKISHQHKVVRIFQNYDICPRRLKFVCICDVYTIGTGQWRRVTPVANLEFGKYSTCTVSNGNLHWLALDLNDSQLWISCFDLETELFSTLSPPISGKCMDSIRITAGLSTFGDCLCICNCNYADGFGIWVMKEYGDKKSWSKQIFICSPMNVNPYNHVYAVNVFSGGELLMVWNSGTPSFYYSKRTKILKKLHMFEEPHGYINAFSYTPSFLSFKSLEMENVGSL